MTTKQILQEEFDLLAIDLIAKHKQLGMKASGKWIDSLETKVSSDKGVLIGEDYTEQLQYGRAKGKFPPIDMIKKWIVSKGLTYDIPINSLAFLIARKISREGWKRKDHGGVELVSQVITPKRIDSIINRVGIEMTLNVVDMIENTYKVNA